MRALVMGGTRFIGVYLTKLLVERGDDVTLFNRGNHPAPAPGVRQLQGDRKDPEQLKAALAGETFDVIFDNNGREVDETRSLVELFAGRIRQFVYVSSAGVYAQSETMPHVEGDALDPNSRHKGKFETEAFLREAGIPWSSVRPVYIYGPQNYNDLEAWFFDRIVRDRPLPIPGHGQHLTHFGHVADLARAMIAAAETPAAAGEIFNISGPRAVTFDGLARACASAAGKSPADLNLVHYNPKQFDFGKSKAFPLRVRHFFTDISRAKTVLNWQPDFDLLSGLKDSYQNDFLAGDRAAAEIDFSLDDEILTAVA